MPNDTIVRAPYNFVPFSHKILSYEDEIPAHDAVDPSLKTGEIHITMTAKTPVFVSNGGKDDAHFFRGPDGNFQIPGSTVRGMVRQNMQILSLSLVRVRVGEDIANQQVFYRSIADATGGTGGELKKYYHTVLCGDPNSSDPKNVKAGYLRKEGGGYYIQPVAGSFLRVSKKVLSTAGLDGRYAQTIPVRYTADGDWATAVYPEGKGNVGQRGILLCPGVDTGGDGTRPDRHTGKTKPPSHRYVFPLPDESAQPVSISEEDELSYAADWESRKNNLKGGTKIMDQKVNYDPDFWKLPGEGQEKPVFYIQHNGHVFFGMSLFLRIGYRFSLKDGLPKSHQEKQDVLDFIDWPRAILGWAGDKTSRRSRVSFGDLLALGSPDELPLVQTVLGNPKISYYPGYVVKGDHYNQEGFLLRGYKQYWLKEEADPTPTDKLSVASKLRPLPAETKFTGVIRYKNLRPEELGLLLWALRLEKEEKEGKNCFQSIGMGKPYGFGRMKLTIDSLREFDFSMLYSPGGLCGGAEAVPNTDDAVQRYIDLYDAFAVQALNIKPTGKDKKQKDAKASLKNYRGIRELFYLHSRCWELKEAKKKVSYMELKEYRNIRNPLPDVAAVRRETEELEKQEVAQQQPLPEDNSIEAMKARLAQRFNSK